MSENTKALMEMMAIGQVLAMSAGSTWGGGRQGYQYPSPNRRANPDKKAARKMKQKTQRRNRR
jgi:hypothetical protein